MSKNKGQVLMTEGAPLPIIIRFSIPLILTAFFQQLYSFIDSMIVGRCISAEALAAVNLTSSLNFVIMGLTMGSSLGFCVPFAQAVGAREKDMTSRYFWNGLYLAAGLSLLGSFLAVPNTYNLLTLIKTPDNLIDMSAEYLSVILIGLLITTMYHFMAGIMRALGDSTHPFYFMLAGNVINILLDLLFIMVLDMGVYGAAVATIISQLFSVILCVYHLFAKMGAIEAKGEDGANYRSFHGFCMKRLITIGLPMGLELSVNGIGSVILQSCVNQLGSVVVTAVAAGEKIRSMITLPLENLGSAMSTYTAQNYGAKNKSRIYMGIKSSLLILVIYCAAAWALVFVLKKPLVYLLLGTTESENAQATVTYLAMISTMFFFHGALQIFRNILQGMGHSVSAILSGVFEIIGRLIGGSLAVYFISFKIVCFANPMAWGLAAAYCLIMTLVYLNRLHWNKAEK